MAKKKRSCKFGRRKDGKCRKRPRRGRRAGKTCKLVRIRGRRQRMCKRGKRWLFAA